MMRTNVLCFSAIILLVLQGAPVCAIEKAIWRLGKSDRSDHEFASAPDPQMSKPVVVRFGTGNETRQWPKFHPGSGNSAFGGRVYRFTLVFDLPTPQPQGVFYLDLSLLFRQPRVPAVDVDINGHCGRYYFNPDPMFEVGDSDLPFLRSTKNRLPCRFSLPRIRVPR